MRISSLLILASLICMAGCGGAGGTTIQGSVKFDDGAPLSQGVVILSNDNNSYRGVVAPDGSYKVVGVVSGSYNVAITGTMAGGSEAPVDVMEWDQEKGEYKNSQGSEGKPPANLLADKFSAPSSSGLKLEVPGDYALTVQSP